MSLVHCRCVQPRDDSFESRASLFQQNAPLSDPCTFRLIAKNVTNLLRDTGAEASQKAAALDSLEALLRCERTPYLHDFDRLW